MGWIYLILFINWSVMKYVRLMNCLGWRKDTLVCMRQESTYFWGSHLGKKTAGVCSGCGEPIYFEIQNRSFYYKICNRCCDDGWEANLVKAC